MMNDHTRERIGHLNTIADTSILNFGARDAAKWAAHILSECAIGGAQRISHALDNIRADGVPLAPEQPPGPLWREDAIREPARYYVMPLHPDESPGARVVEIVSGPFLVNIQTRSGTNAAITVTLSVLDVTSGGDRIIGTLKAEAP